MTDHRSMPDPVLVTRNEPAQIVQPYIDLLRRPDGPRDRQLLYGDTVRELDRANGWSYVQAEKDQYCGFVSTSALAQVTAATHTIASRGSHLYSKPDIKSPDRMCLSFGSRVTALSQTEGFLETSDGFVPMQHVRPVSEAAGDVAVITALFLGTPYLWGGNTQFGIDCSGLVQAALLACGMDCPGDSDQQCESLGEPVSGNAGFQRNDLLFWKGHVAIVVDPETLIHANAGHMATTYEPIEAALARIKRNGDGDLIAHKRL
jgi:cell wall-associated NlpC family hydrolase